MPLGKGYTITYDGVVSTEQLPELGVERVRRKLLGKTRHVMREVSGRSGAWQFGEKRGLKTIFIDCYGISDRDSNPNPFPILRREFLTRVAEWVDKEGFRPLIISDEPDRYYMATIVGEPDLDEWRDRSKFTLEFAAEPYAYAMDLSENPTSLTSGVEYTFLFHDSVPAYPVIELQAAGGNVAGFTLNVNGAVLTRTADIPSGQWVTISSLSYTVTPGESTDPELTGDFDPETAEMSTVSGTFPVLIPNQTQSVIATKLGGSATAINARITWRPRFP